MKMIDLVLNNLTGGKAATAMIKGDLNDIYGSVLTALTCQNMPINAKLLAVDNADIKSQFPDGEKVWINVHEVSPGYTSIRLKVAGNDYRANSFLNKIQSQISNPAPAMM